MPRWRKSKRSAAVIASVAVLAGCQAVSDFASKPREIFASKPGETCIPNDASVSKKHVSTAVKPAGKNQTVTLNRAAVRRLQTQLTKLGFEPGPVDGIVGARTKREIKSYQSLHCLPPSGGVTRPFLKHLEATAASWDATAAAPINMGPKDFTKYELGTTFIYSNGDVDRVSDVKPTAVQWGRDDGTIYTTHRNFLLPRLYWSADDERGTAKILGATDKLWPLREGAEVAFSAKVTVQQENDQVSTDRRVDRWRCQNKGLQKVTVKAGTFETVVFVCKRGTKPTSPDLVRTWYYSKDVRHYVRFVENDPQRKSTTTVDLVAVRPAAPRWPPIVGAGLARAIVYALETEGQEYRMPWTSSAVNTHVTIEAKSRLVGQDGTRCRRFMQIWQEKGDRRHYPALACKTELGKWVIPGIQSNSANSLAVSGKVS